VDNWIIDPQKRTITVLELADGIYRESGVFEPGQVWRTDKPFPLTFDPGEVF